MTCLNIIQLAGDAAQLAEGREGPPSLLCVCGGKAIGVYFAEEMDSEKVKLLLLPGSLQLSWLALTWSNKARPAKFALVFQVGSLCKEMD